jgi:hypothetical protein
VIAIPLILTLLASDTKMLIIFIGVWMILLAVDTIPVMIGIKKDEREAQVEAIAERNTAWFMSIVLVFSVVYDISRAVIERWATLPVGFNDGLTTIMNDVNGFTLVALIGWVIVKSVSNYILDRE